MNFLEKFAALNWPVLSGKTKPQPADMDPDQISAPEGVETSKYKRPRPKIDFRGDDRAANPEGDDPAAHGLPSVNRRAGSNRVVTALGFVGIACVAGGLIYANTGEKKPAEKKVANQQKIQNTLPAIAIPPAPAAIQVAELPPAAGQAPAIPLRGQPAGGAQAGGSPMSPAAAMTAANKEPSWWERKAGGSMLVSAGMSMPTLGADSPASARQAPAPSGPLSVADFARPPAAGADQGGGDAPRGSISASLTGGLGAAPVSATMLGNRDYLITRGASIDCAMETAIDSSVPGLTSCRVTQDVYSENGRVVLIDRGSQLVGEYKSGMKTGQVRLFLVWTRLKTPNGVIVNLDSPGADALGRSGVAGWVDEHFAQRFGAAVMMSLLSDAISAASGGAAGAAGATNNYYGNSAKEGGKIVEKILESSANIPPVIIKNQGDHIRVMLARDLDFSGVYSLQMRGEQ